MNLTISKLTLMTLMASLLWGCKTDMGTVEIIDEKVSPNGELVVSTYSCQGGGAAGFFYFNADLRKVGEKLNPKNHLLGKHRSWKAFHSISARWIDDKNLELSYYQSDSADYKENNSVKVDSKYGVKINHVITNKNNG